MPRSLVFSAALIAAMLLGIGLQYAFVDAKAQRPTNAVQHKKADITGQYRPGFSLKDQHGLLRNLDEWDGKVVLVNFWASWCPPCKKEIPALMALQEQYSAKGLQVIGVAIDDEQSVKKYSDSVGINYPVMAAELAAAEIARRYGNTSTALPFTAFVGRDGKIVLTRSGELSLLEAVEIIEPLL